MTRLVFPAGHRILAIAGIALILDESVSATASVDRQQLADAFVQEGRQDLLPLLTEEVHIAAAEPSEENPEGSPEFHGLRVYNSLGQPVLQAFEDVEAAVIASTTPSVDPVLGLADLEQAASDISNPNVVIDEAVGLPVVVEGVDTAPIVDEPEAIAPDGLPNAEVVPDPAAASSSADAEDEAIIDKAIADVEKAPEVVTDAPATGSADVVPAISTNDAQASADVVKENEIVVQEPIDMSDAPAADAIAEEVIADRVEADEAAPVAPEGNTVIPVPANVEHDGTELQLSAEDMIGLDREDLVAIAFNHEVAIEDGWSKTQIVEAIVANAAATGRSVVVRLK